MKPLSFLRFFTKPRTVAPPKGNVDLFWDAEAGSFKARDSDGGETAIGGAVTGAAIEAAGGALEADHPVNGSVMLSTPKAFAKAVAGTAPIRYAVIGDSMTTGFDLSPSMAKRGFIGLLAADSLITGTVTNYGRGSEGDPEPDFENWINGTFQRFAVSSSGEFVPNGVTGLSGYTQGDKAAIAYIAKPGGGTFRLQSKTSAGVTAVLAASIDTSKDGDGNTVSVPTGVVKEYNLSTSTYPAFRLVVDTVATGAVDILFGAIYPTTGGGVIETRILANARGGLELYQSLETTTAVLEPIWEWLAPDVVFSLWADEGAEWESGGDWRTLYARLKAAYANSDFVQISRNPSDGADAICAAQVVAQKAWAEEADESFIDVQSLVGGTYAAANANGLMGDVVHLNTTGTALRNAHLWKLLPLGNLQLGAWGPDRIVRTLAEPAAAPTYKVGAVFAFESGFRVPDSGATSTNDFWLVDSTNKVMSLKRNSTVFFTISGAIDGTGGFYPGFDGMYLGNTSFRWRTHCTSIDANGALTFSNASITCANLPTYADNAAAVAGGLAAGRLYKTATGEVRVRV